MAFWASRMLVAGATAAVATGCGSADREPGLVSVDPVGHVHAVDLDPRDRSILVASHNGLFRAEEHASRAVLVGDERRDVMGFSVEAPGRYAGSGHPDVRRGGPTSVGLIRSSDGGRSWQTVSLEGRADLHALEVSGRRVYAFDALTGKFLRSSDGGQTWSASLVPPLLDLAVDPDDIERVVVSTQQGLLASEDGGKTFRNAGDLPLSHLAWGTDGITAVGEDRVVQHISPDLRTIDQLGRSPAVPAAMSQTDEGLLLATDDGTVYASVDGGRSWTPKLEAVR